MSDPKDVKILIVDDEVALRKAIAYDFRKKGFQVLEAGSGSEALEVVKKEKVDLILTDVRMPDGDGVQLLDELKAQDPRVPVVMFITGFADLSMEDAYDKGADAVFSKPFDRKELLAAVVRALEDKKKVWGGRKTERLEVDLGIRLKFAHWDQAIQGRVLNIGRGGIFVALNENFPTVNGPVSFEISFSQGDLQAIQGDGVVRWIRTQSLAGHPKGCGIEFQYLSDSSRDSVVELIGRLKMKAFIPKS